MIRISGVSVEGRLLPLSFDCESGQILHVIGPNGSGKSTLLSAIAGVTDFKGSVTVDDIDVASCSYETLSQYRAYLSQSERPAFNLDVFQYLSLSIPAFAQSQPQLVSEVVNELSDLVAIQDKLHRSIHQLSGGEWQRVRLAAICLQIWPSLNPYAKLLILDEPAAPLDIGQESLLYRLIKKVAEQGITVIMANHDLNRTLRHADQALLLQDGVLHAFGLPSNVLTEQLLEEVFKTQVVKTTVNERELLIFD